MFALLKIARLAITALCILILFITFRYDDIVGLILTVVPVVIVLTVLWLVPMLFGHRRPAAPVKYRDGFIPAIAHDNIALDAEQGVLWIRDPTRGERYLLRSDILAAKTDHDWHNGTFRQRIELQIADIANPQCCVLFERHSDRWIKTSKINGQERDEWFARLKAWTGLATLK